VEYLEDGNAKQAALRAGIPETYAARQGQWLKKHAMVVAAIENEIDENELRQLRKAINEINARMETCKTILGLE
jgi:phage terminase small subunit